MDEVQLSITWRNHVNKVAVLWSGAQSIYLCQMGYRSLRVIFRVLHPIGKQAYKLDLFKSWKIHNIFYVSLLEHDTTRKGRVDEEIRQMKFNNNGNGNNNREYKVEAIWDSAVYARELEVYLLGLYYLVSWKRYSEEENT